MKQQLDAGQVPPLWCYSLPRRNHAFSRQSLLSMRVIYALFVGDIVIDVFLF